MSIQGYAAKESGGQLDEFQYDARALGPYDVSIKVTHCGICHSDVHLLDDDWDMTNFPFVPGHEVVGIVEEMGPQVTHLKAGDRVGVGWQCGACMDCEWCMNGEENNCAQGGGTCVNQFGGFADRIITDGRFAFVLPDALESARAAPLFCGGATVYSPLRQYATSPTTKVGVVGIGGLGHFALQFAKAFGCEVTAFSSSAEKEEEAMRLGASRFVSSTDAAALEKEANSLDLIICTATAGMNWEAYMNILRPRGRFCLVGASPEPVTVSAFTLIMKRKVICGSNIAGRPEIVEMLDFCARNGIGAETEVYPMSQVNQAMEHVRSGKAKYRVVLEN